VTHLRQRMLDELQRRNYSQRTVTIYIHAVEEFSKHFHRSPERLGPSHIREYQVHLFRDRKLSPGTIQSRCAALRFLFVKTLRRPYLLDEIPLPKRVRGSRVSGAQRAGLHVRNDAEVSANGADGPLSQQR